MIIWIWYKAQILDVLVWLFFCANSLEKDMNQCRLDSEALAKQPVLEKENSKFQPVVSKVDDHSWGWPESSLFNSYYTEMLRRALLLSLDCTSLPLKRTLYCRVLSKVVSRTILKVFDMTRPGIEPRSSGPLANTLPTRPMSFRLKTDLVSYLFISFHFSKHKTQTHRNKVGWMMPAWRHRQRSSFE